MMSIAIAAHYFEHYLISLYVLRIGYLFDSLLFRENVLMGLFKPFRLLGVVSKGASSGVYIVDWRVSKSWITELGVDIN